MGQLSIIAGLPAEKRQAIEEEIINRSFGGYAGLAEWIKSEHGIDLSHVAVWRHGKKIQERLDKVKLATEYAKTLNAAVGDDEAALTAASLQLVQEQIISVLMSTDNVATEDLGKLAQAAGTVARASVIQKKHATDIRKKTKEAAAAVGQSLSDIPKEKREAVRAIILGIAGNA